MCSCDAVGVDGLVAPTEHPSTGERCGEEAVGSDGGELAHGGGGSGVVPERTPYLEGMSYDVSCGSGDKGRSKRKSVAWEGHRRKRE